MNPNWTPVTPIAVEQIIIDINGNVQQATAAGTTGATLPVFGTIVGAITNDGSVVWTCAAVLSGTSLPPELVGLPPPVFVNDVDGLDPQKVLDDMVAEFIGLTNRPLYPAQLERLLINLYAFREALIRNIIQYAGTQSLLAFANYPNIDYLGALLGTERLDAAGALTTLTFTLTAVLSQPYTRPVGTIVGTQDGAVQFKTTVEVVIPAGTIAVSVPAVCTTKGVAGNGYAPGQVSVMLPADARVTVANTTATADGAPIESTDRYRARIQQAPNRFSVAGPAAAYRFFALSVDPTVQDVDVTSPLPGQVTIAVLGAVRAQPAMSGSQGIVSQPLLDQIAAKVSGDTVRPLCDTVTVLPADEVDYAVDAIVTLAANADPESARTALLTAAEAFALRIASRLKQDIVPEEWIAVLGSIGTVYRVQVAAPAYQQLLDGQWANCTAIKMTLVDINGVLLGTI